MRFAYIFKKLHLRLVREFNPSSYNFIVNVTLLYFKGKNKNNTETHTLRTTGGKS